MNKINCHCCGIVNWTSAENCVKCKSELKYSPEATAATTATGYVERSASADYANYESNAGGFFRSRVFYGAVVLIGLIFIYSFFLKSSTNESKIAADSGTNANVAEIAVAAPPADMRITAPTLEDVLAGAPNEIRKNNTASSFGNSPVASYADIYSPEAQRKAHEAFKKSSAEIDAEVNRRMGGGSYGSATENAFERGQRIRGEVIVERNEQQSADLRASEVRCAPQLKDAIKLADGGRYHKFDDKIFYSVKVRADGLEGTVQNNQCVSKPAVGGLTATIYLKWQITSPGMSNWHLSTESEMQTLSLAHQKQRKETLEKAREDAKRPESDWRK